MTMLVLDCSVAVSWLFEDEASKKTDAILDIVKDEGAWVPNLWHLEVTNVLIQAAKRERISINDVHQQLKLLSILPIKTDDQTHSVAFIDVLDLAVKNKLTSYDAAYLELTIRRKIRLATKDKALLKASKKYNVAFNL